MERDRKRPKWDEFFMYFALVSATRSSCRKFNTGAVIVSEKNRIISSGYNGAAPNAENCLELGCRKDEQGVDFEDKGKSSCRGTHAELNAINHARRDLTGTTMYSVHYPCSACAKAIAGVEIGEVVYCREYKEEGSLTKEEFDKRGIILRQLEVDAKNLMKYFKSLKGE